MLAAFEDMNIDKDFNVWDDFRNSIAVKGRGSESLESLITRSSISQSAKSHMSIGQSASSTTPVVGGVRVDLLEEQLSDVNEESKEKGPSDEVADPLVVSFSELTAEERR
jgi:hypothetical protein